MRAGGARLERRIFCLEQMDSMNSFTQKPVRLPGWPLASVIGGVFTASAVLRHGGTGFAHPLFDFFLSRGHYPLDVLPRNMSLCHLQTQEVLVRWKEHEFGVRWWVESLQLHASFVSLFKCVASESLGFLLCE